MSADANGLAAFTPSSAGFSPPVTVDIAITTGTSASLDDALELLPALAGSRYSVPDKPPAARSSLRLRSLSVGHGSDP